MGSCSGIRLPKLSSAQRAFVIVCLFAPREYSSSMKLRSLQFAILTVPLFGAPAFAADQAYSKVEINTTKLAGSVYMREGAGGTTGVCAGDDGIGVVDDQFAPLA